MSNTIDGIGDYYDPACNVPEGQELPPGCGESCPGLFLLLPLLRLALDVCVV